MPTQKPKKRVSKGLASIMKGMRETAAKQDSTHVDNAVRKKWPNSGDAASTQGHTADNRTRRIPLHKFESGDTASARKASRSGLYSRGGKMKTKRCK